MTLKYLQDKEWSMGNGQCPECYGKPIFWFGTIHCLTADTIGHEKDCELAETIKELGGNPLMMGDYKSEVIYECYWNDNGILATRQKAKGQGCNK